MKSAGTLYNNNEVVAKVFCVVNISEKRGIKEANGRFRIIKGEDKFRSLFLTQSEFLLKLDNGYQGNIVIGRPGELIGFKSTGPFKRS